MQIDSADPMDVDYYLGCYQQELLRLIRILVSTGDTVTDVGAQKWFISLILSKQVGLHGCVISVEPDPRAMQFLANHVQRNRCGNVITCNYGLGATVESCAFALSVQLGWLTRYPN
jgi:Met-10+ like-protein